MERVAKGDPKAIEQARKLGLLPTPCQLDERMAQAAPDVLREMRDTDPVGLPRDVLQPHPKGRAANKATR
jgi:hypothetical protein